MGKNNIPDPPNYKKYGVPFYSVAWVPYKSIRFHRKLEEENQNPDQTQSSSDDNNAATAVQKYVVLAGGGGEGRSGIPNAIVLIQFDITSNSLSDQPVNILFFYLFNKFLKINTKLADGFFALRAGG